MRTLALAVGFVLATLGTPLVAFATCGDGNLDPGEECDDGNRNSCDGCSFLCRTEAPGASWCLAGGPQGGKVLALVIDPQNPAVLYAGTEVAGVFKSGDGGKTWRSVDNGAGLIKVSALAVSPPPMPGSGWVKTGERVGPPETLGCPHWAITSLGVSN
jgi:cysteine-rich repeat protein